MLTSAQRQTLEKGLSTTVEYDCPLKAHTTFRIGGPASALVVVEDKTELMFLLAFCRRENLASLCIGRGSNLLVADHGFAGVAFRLGKGFGEVTVSASDRCSGGGVTVRVGAALSLAGLSRICTEKGLTGLEFSAGIPGSLGGAVVMNAGAWGGEMAGVVRGVELVSDETVLFAEEEQLDFGYRCWPWFAARCRQHQLVVTAVKFQLAGSSPDEVAFRCRELAGRRKERQRIQRPNAGSFFRNPDGKSAGQLIESCGLKGFRVGNAMVACEHANFFVNMGGARASEMLELMEIVQKNVQARYGVELQPEVKIIG